MNVLFSSLRGASGADAPRSLYGDDARWVHAAQDGDAQAYNQLIVRHQERAYRVAYHLLHDAHVAANVTQSVLVNAFQTLPELGDETFQVWLLRLLTQRCAAFLQLYPAPTTARSAIEMAMETLPLPERITLVLADLEKLAPQDIAKITRTDPATVRTRTHRARCAVRDVLTAAPAQHG